MQSTLSLVPGQIPDHIKNAKRRLNLNAAASANIQAGYAVLIYKGAQWAVRHKGETLMLEASPGLGHDGRPLPKAPVATIDVVICGVGEVLTKTWYKEGYIDGSQNAPDCASINGKVPDPGVPDPQHTNCQLCQWNVFGTATGGSGRGKACRDNKRVAVVPAGDERNAEYDGPMLLRIPPTSLRNFDKYSKDLVRFGTDMSEVVTRLSFQKGLSYPLFEFQAVAWLDGEPYQIIQEWADSDEVHRILYANDIVEAKPAPAPAQMPATIAQLPPRPPRPVAPATRTAPAQEAQAPAQAIPTVTVSPFVAAKAAQQAQAAAATTGQATPAPVQAPVTTKVTPQRKPAAKSPSNGGGPAPQVVKGVPDDMASVIDGMLGDDDDEVEE